MNLVEENGVVETDGGAKYYLAEFLWAIAKFNDECPKLGGLIMRSEIGHMSKITHATKLLKYEDNKLIAELELYEDDSSLNDAKIRPIISIPLRFGSGIECETVLSIMNVFLEI